MPVLFVNLSKRARFVSDDIEVHKKIIRRTLEAAAKMNLDDPPPIMAAHIQRSIRDFTGCDDPYLSVKRHFNRRILELLDGFREQVRQSENPFNTAVRLAIAGNIIDFGPFANVDGSMIHDAVDRALRADIRDNSIRRIEHEIGKAQKVLYLADNAGEIVFDRLLIEQMPLDKITLVIKGGPIINDALLEDAQDVGLTEMVEVVDNGSEAAGTALENVLRRLPSAIQDRRRDNRKGTGKLRNTKRSGRKHLLPCSRAKCPVIAGDVGCEVGDMIVRHKEECGLAAETAADVA